MSFTTVVGPLKTESEANETAFFLGGQYSVYSKIMRDTNGLETNDREWFVERDDSIVSNIFGYSVNEFIKKQYK